MKCGCASLPLVEQDLLVELDRLEGIAMGETPSEASSWIEAVEQALGVTWAQMMAWIGPCVMTLWCWTR